MYPKSRLTVKLAIFNENKSHILNVLVKVNQTVTDMKEKEKQTWCHSEGIWPSIQRHRMIS